MPDITELAEIARACRLLSTPMDKMIDALKERMKVGDPDIKISGGYGNCPTVAAAGCSF